MKNKKSLTVIQRELATILRSKIQDDDAYLGTMLALIVNQPNPDENCMELLKYIRANPEAEYEDILIKSDDILGIVDPFGGGE